MASRDDELWVKPGQIRNRQAPRKAKSYVAQVMRAAKKAGHSGKRFDGKNAKGGSRFGRGCSAAAGLAMRSPKRRVVVMARVVRHQGRKFRSAPLARHLAYLKREGVTRDGQDARMFDAKVENADGEAFAKRCEDDRHHFRFTVSPEDAPAMADLRSFTRELLRTAERDLDTKLDWLAVDHWNTDNPHIHVLVRGKADDGKDLVISRDYISRGLRVRAADLITLELGPRTEREIQTSQQKEVDAERWTGLDKALRDRADHGAGIADLRPGTREDPEGRRLLVGRVAKLEKLGLAEQVAPGCWMLKPGLEQTLRDLAIRGDVIKTMHRAMQGIHKDVDVGGFAIHSEAPAQPVVGRLVSRGLFDELKGTAFAIIDGVDGCTHHLQFSNLETTGDAAPGAIVESRAYDDGKGKRRLALAVRSDLTLTAQITASGATWLDRQLLGNDARLANAGFGADLQDAMAARVDHLVQEGLARRQGARIVFAPDLLNTLRQRELDDAAQRISAKSGLPYRPAQDGQTVSGIYRERIALASGRFAMIDNGPGFQLVPWRPALEPERGRLVRGSVQMDGTVTWSFGRGLNI
jgi:type IV secretory pathway VirD2 relaxase